MSRTSKYKHVFGTAFKRDYAYDNVRATENAWDGNFIKANPSYFAVSWKTGGGGAFAVVPHTATGRLPQDQPLFLGHTRPVLDLDFHPFNDNIIASGGEDATIRIWQIPEGGAKTNQDESLLTLSQHSKKVGFLQFHPSANNVLMSAGMDPCVKIWDIEKGDDKVTLNGFKDLILSVDWNSDGSQVGSSCKDKKLRIFDPRVADPVVETDGHQGPKSSRFMFLHGRDRAFTVGFSPKSTRQYMMWDTRNWSKPLVEEDLDSDTGLLLPFYDPDTGVIFISGKGETTIRYYDTAYDKILPLSTFSNSSTPARGMCMMPKRVLDVAHCEIARILKLTRNNTVEPIRFEVPRKDESFQADLFPDTNGPEPALTADQFFAGSNAAPKKISLNPDSGAPVKAFVPFNPTPTAAQAKPTSAPVPSVSKPSPSTTTAAPAAAKQDSSAAELAAARAEIAELKQRIAELEEANRTLSEENQSIKASMPPAQSATAPSEDQWE